MARNCEVCGKGSQWGHKVSHANNISNRRWYPNLQSVRVLKGVTPVRMRVCTRCLRSNMVAKNTRKPGAAATA